LQNQTTSKLVFQKVRRAISRLVFCWLILCRMVTTIFDTYSARVIKMSTVLLQFHNNYQF